MRKSTKWRRAITRNRAKYLVKGAQALLYFVVSKGCCTDEESEHLMLAAESIDNAIDIWKKRVD